MIMADMSEFPYPLNAMPMFVLQVAPLDVHGGHVKDLPPLPLPFFLFRGFFLSLYLFDSCSLYLSLCVDTIQAPSSAAPLEMRKSAVKGHAEGITCMAWSLMWLPF